MKCVFCQHDCKYKERSDGKCPQCHRLFTFEPRNGDPVTDVLFHNAIEAVSAEGRIRWGVEHLYYEVCRRKRIGFIWPGAVIGAMTIACVVFLCLGFTVAPQLFIVALVTALLAAFAAYRRTSAPFVQLERATFDRLWQRWRDGHGSPKGLIVRREQLQKPRAAEPDLADYSFDRAVVCDRARTVDLLLTNNFHFENNCAVLSIDGYPPVPFPTVRAMLKRNPNLQVFALHDATPAGCRLARRLASDPEWFAGQVRVVDVGLRPSHAGRFFGLLLRAEGGAVAPDQDLAEADARWLSAYALELAAVRPEQVLKRLYRAINRKFDPDEGVDAVVVAAGNDGGDGDGGFEADIVSFSGDAGDADGGADSFG